MKRFFVSLVFVALAVNAAFAQSKYSTYNNARFGYLIQYPADLLEMQAEADNGDGTITGYGAFAMKTSQSLIGEGFGFTIGSHPSLASIVSRATAISFISSSALVNYGNAARCR